MARYRVLLAKYGIPFGAREEETIEADHYKVEDGWFIFYRESQSRESGYEETTRLRERDVQRVDRAD